MGLLTSICLFTRENGLSNQYSARQDTAHVFQPLEHVYRVLNFTLLPSLHILKGCFHLLKNKENKVQEFSNEPRADKANRNNTVGFNY